MIVVDVETSGLSAYRNGLLSIGAVDFADPERQFSGECRVWDGAEIESQALAVNGYSLEDARDPAKATEAELITEFAAWMQAASDQTIAGQNPSFDHGFLRAAVKRAGIAWYPSRRLIDLHSLAFAALLRAELPLPRDSSGRSTLASDAIMAVVGLPAEPKPHIAINGAVWETEAFARLIYGANLLPQFALEPIPDYLAR